VFFNHLLDWVLSPLNLTILTLISEMQAAMFTREVEQDETGDTRLTEGGRTIGGIWFGSLIAMKSEISLVCVCGL